MSSKACGLLFSSVLEVGGFYQVGILYIVFHFFGFLRDNSALDLVVTVFLSYFVHAAFYGFKLFLVARAFVNGHLGNAVIEARHGYAERTDFERRQNVSLEKRESVLCYFAAKDGVPHLLLNGEIG